MAKVYAKLQVDGGISPNIQTEYYCDNCYRWFKTLDHFNRYRSFCQQSRPSYRCKDCEASPPLRFVSKVWAVKHWLAKHVDDPTEIEHCPYCGTHYDFGLGELDGRDMCTMTCGDCGKSIKFKMGLVGTDRDSSGMHESDCF